MTGFDVEDLLVDNYYYFDKSTKKKRTSWLNTATFVMWSIGRYLNMLAPDG